MTTQGRQLLPPQQPMTDEQAAAIDLSNYRTFVSVSEPNTVFQVVEANDDQHPENKPLFSQESGAIHKTSRKGDKFAEFNDGLCMTDDPDVISYLERMYPTVMDMAKAETGLLVMIARTQVPRNNYEPETTTDLVGPAAATFAASMEVEIQRRLLVELEKRGALPANPEQPEDELQTRINELKGNL